MNLNTPNNGPRVEFTPEERAKIVALGKASTEVLMQSMSPGHAETTINHINSGLAKDKLPLPQQLVPPDKH